MSPLPKRRKSAEELADLRKSLGISPEGPPADAPGVSRDTVEWDPPAELKKEESEAPQEAAPFAEVSPFDTNSTTRVEAIDGEDVIRVSAPKSVRSLRKSERLPVDRPRPKSKRKESGVLPTRRHSDQEIGQLRKAAQFAPHAEGLVPKGASRITVVALYGLSGIIFLIGLLGILSSKVPLPYLPFDWLKMAAMREDFLMILFGIFCGGAGLFLLVALWLAIARPLSRHHAGFMTIIAVLVLVFGTLYFFPGLHGA